MNRPDIEKARSRIEEAKARGAEQVIVPIEEIETLLDYIERLKKGAGGKGTVNVVGTGLGMNRKAWVKRIGFASRVHEARERHIPPMTQTELARRLQMDESRMSRIVHGSVLDPRISTVCAIAEALDITIDELLGWEWQ